MAYDPDATRQHILDAAESEFACYGPAGARVDRIAATAGVNKQAIYHHFGTKDVLLATVLRQRLDALADDIPLEPDHLGDYVGRLFDFHVAHPELVRLVLWEGLSSTGGAVVAEPERRAHYADKIDAVTRAQAAGTIDPTLDPRHVVLAILSLINWSLAAGQVTRMLYHRSDDSADDPMNADNLASRRAFVVEAVRRICAG